MRHDPDLDPTAPQRSSPRDILWAMAEPTTYRFDAEVWEWSAKNSWYFLSVPEEDADDIEERHRRRAAGFGSIRVEVTIGSSTWRTSLFPSNQERTYVLPLKKAVRTAEGIEPGSTVAVELVVVTD